MIGSVFRIGGVFVQIKLLKSIVRYSKYYQFLEMNEHFLMHCEGCDEYYVYGDICKTCEKRRIVDSGENDHLFDQEEEEPISRQKFLKEILFYGQFWRMTGLIGWDIINDVVTIWTNVNTEQLMNESSPEMKKRLKQGLKLGYVQIIEDSLEDKLNRLQITTRD